MNALTPAAWQDVGTVAVVLVFVFSLMVSLVRGWVIFGPAHKELMRVKDEVIAHFRETEGEKDKTIAAQAETIRQQTVSGEISAHLLQAFKDAARGGGSR